MLIQRLLILSLLCLLAGTNLYSQTESDTTKVWDENDWNWEWEDFRLDGWRLKGSPSISILYGFSNQTLDGLNGSLKDPNLVGVKLGYISERATRFTENISRYRYSNLHLSNFSTGFSGSSNSTGYESSMWRFGFGRESGYGYKVGSVSIIPYYAYSLDWSRLNLKNTPVDSLDKARLALFNESFRFGTSSYGGIKIKIIENLSVDAAYERSAVFQRHLFWKWAGSAIIESAAQGLLDSFISKIMRSSPYAGPIANFILKNALSYGVYELRKEKMNWPFSSEAPLMYDQFKFGVTFIF